MILQEVMEDIPTIQSFIDESCNRCAANDWYCPSLCEDLQKAKRMPFDKIQMAYARHDGDMVKVFRYIKQYRL